MCEICSTAKSNSAYNELLSKMAERDLEIMENTKKISEDMKVLKELNYSSVKWPIKLNYPFFEARNAFAVPNNYFQPLFINGGKMSVFFSHGSTRSLFFSGDKLMLYSKTVNHKEGLDYFTSFALIHFEKGEYDVEFIDNNLTIKANLEKKLKNLVTGEIEKKKISFNFVQKSLLKKFLTKEQAATSHQMKIIYEKHGSLQSRLASSDMAGYVITVPHFSPHPYMLQLHKEFGFGSNREFQEKGVLKYFKTHLGLE